MSRHTVRVDEEDLDEYLDDAENKSELVREAVRLYRLKNGAVDDARLTDKQRAAYAWLREYVGVEETMQYEVVQTVLSQKLSLGKEIVKELVLKPLDRLGYLDVTPRMHHVIVEVRPPDVVDGKKPTTPDPDDPDGAGETLDALEAAGEGVAEGAD
ncbi:hypothetical protein [Halobacterium jilantaiense]|uniref:Uncharacterized protein n=1 Tax=Halobacterium jilantaiense TaxID=355548 RepID=A0A1I0P6Z8_9EURY|nr:hypothetical protein [Halobacterium jilantaiense]SEW09960.1 hypothetical protein SAMN04487945_1440 [Halobacterium jilantaiense]